VSTLLCINDMMYVHTYVIITLEGSVIVVSLHIDTISHGSFRSKRKQQQELPAEHLKITAEALRETPPLRKKINLKPRRQRLRPLVHFDHQSIPLVFGALPASNKQFGMLSCYPL